MNMTLFTIRASLVVVMTLSVGCGDNTVTVGAGGSTATGTGGAGGSTVKGTGGAGGSTAKGTGGAGGSTVKGTGGAGGSTAKGTGGAGGSTATVDSSVGSGGKAGTTTDQVGGAGGTAGATASEGGSAGGNTDGGQPGTGGTIDTGPADFTKFKDPGKGEWEKGTPAECKMDPTKFVEPSGLSTYAVFRYGKLCHMKGNDSTGSMFSATKTLGGVMSGRAAYVAKDVVKSGPGTGPIRHLDIATDWIASARAGATISHVMAMVAYASRSLDEAGLKFSYDTVGSNAINGMIAASEKSFKQVPAFASLSASSFVKKEVFEKLGMKSSSWGGSMIGTGWSANMTDMGKLGTLMLHDGWYGGERLISQEWMYRMSHPGFESANTSYGQLAWLNHRGNATGIGGNISSGSNSPDGDPCAPACFWSKYPHPPSEAPDCKATVAGASCTQQYDVGIYSGQGLGGQFIVMHPGLDLVMVAQNFGGGDGPMGMWAAVRPGIIAVDPKYKGDETAFCKDYGAGNYAPDLVVPRWTPTW